MFSISYQAGVSDVTSLMDDLWDHFKVEATISYVQGRSYIRLSCQVYNCLEDFVRVTAAIKKLYGID